MVVAHGGVGVTNTLDQHTTRGLKKIRVMTRPEFLHIFKALESISPRKPVNESNLIMQI